MHFSRKFGSTVQTNMRLEVTPPGGQGAGYVFLKGAGVARAGSGAGVVYELLVTIGANLPPAEAAWYAAVNPDHRGV